MEKRQTASVAVAGAVAAAAVLGAAMTGTPNDPGMDRGPMPVVETQEAAPGFVDAVSILQDAIHRLVDKGVERGMDLANPGENATPGINSVISEMDRMAPTSGTTRAVKVSKEGLIPKRSSVRVCQEFDPGHLMSFAEGDVNIIAVASASEDPKTPSQENTKIAILFTQEGDTKLVTVDIDHGEMGTRPPVTILEGRLIQSAAMTLDNRGYCLIAYNLDGDGVMSGVRCSASGNFHYWTLPWMEGGDPTNISMDYDPVMGLAEIVCTRLPEGSSNEADRYAALVTFPVQEAPDMSKPTATETPLTPEAWPCLSGISYSTADVPKSWDVAFACNWYYAADAGDENAARRRDYVTYITYPTADGEGRGIIVVAQTVYTRTSTVLSYQLCPIAGTSATARLNPFHSGDEFNNLGLTALVHGLTRTNDNATSSFIDMEIYATLKKDDKPVHIMRRVSETQYGADISRLCVGDLGAGAVYYGYSYGNQMYAGIAEFHTNGVGIYFGPEINVATFVNFAQIVTVSAWGGEYAAVVYQAADGNGYIKLLQSSRVVAQTTVDQADGTALEAGYPGQLIRADMTFWPN